MWREGALLLVFTESYWVFAKEMVTVSDRIQFHSPASVHFVRFDRSSAMYFRIFASVYIAQRIRHPNA